MQNYGDMDRTDVNRLIAGGETYTVEFKRALSKQVLNDRDLVEAVVCLANGSGGHLLLGVEDDGTITGAGPRHRDTTDSSQLRALIINQTDPSVAVDVTCVAADELVIVVIEVPDMPTPVGTTGGVYKRRTTNALGKPACVPYRPHEMMSAGFSLTGRDYAEVPARGVTMADLDQAEFDRLRRLCRTGRGDPVLADASDEQICRALRVSRGDARGDDILTIGAVLLFGQAATLAHHAPTAECLFQVFDRQRITTSETLRMPLLRAAEELFGLSDRLNDEQELMVGIHRVGVPKIPRATLRESIANALVHRDYAQLGPIQVRLNEDEFRVHSPGGFPPGVTLTNFLEQSTPRSVVLADAFKRAGLVDRAGRGIPDMFVSQLRAGRDAPDYSQTNDRSVTVSVQTSTSDLDLVRFVITYEEQHGSIFGLDQLQILHQLRSFGVATLSELSETLLRPMSTLRTQAARLVELGLIEIMGRGRNREYRLSAGFYQAAEDRNAYVRAGVADPVKQDELVVRYVTTYASISRSEAAELLMLTGPQARQALQRLVKSGQLRIVGQRRGARYVMVDEAT